MRLATWNVNSVRARLPRLLGWLEQAGPDVVCLQETKTDDAGFPFDEVSALGYEVAHHGDGRWNGVALLSRVGLADVRRGLDGDPRGEQAEPRAVGATCDGVRVWSLYVPNGRTVEDPHYAYKLAWLARLRDQLAAEAAAGAELAVCGDMNVAPTDADVWDAAQFVGSTHVTPAEREAVAQLLALGLHDVVRERWPDDVVFSYWDYRAGMFQKDMGMRIDLVLVSAAVTGRVRAAWVDRAARKGTGTSDHAPVVVDLDTAPSGDIGPVVPPPSVRRGRR